MTKRNKTLKKKGGSRYLDEYEYYRPSYDYSSQNRMSRELPYNDRQFNSKVIEEYNRSNKGEKIQSDSNVCIDCNSPPLTIFNLMKFFGIVRKDPNATLDSILKEIKNDPKFEKKCKNENDTRFCKGDKLDEQKIRLCYHCNKKYIQRVYNEINIDVIPTLYVPEVDKKWLKDVDFEQIDEKNKTSKYSTKKTLYLFVRFKNYNQLDRIWRKGGHDVYTINLYNSAKDKSKFDENEGVCKQANIGGPCKLNDLLEAHFNNIVTIILNSYIAGPDYGQSLNNVYYDKIMYYSDVDENILLTSKDNILQEDKNYYEKIKNTIKEYLNIRKLNQMVNDKLKNYYQIYSTNITLFSKRSIKKPDIFINLSSYKDKMTEKEYKNLETIMKKLEEVGLLDKQRRLQERKSKTFHTITINTLNINHEDNIDDKDIMIRNYSPLNSFPELTGKDQIIYFTPEVKLYKSDLTNPVLFDTTRKLEDKNLIEVFLDPNKLSTLLEYIPKTPDRYVNICSGAEKDGKCDTTKLINLLQKDDSKQRDIIVNNINLILDLLFDSKPIHLSFSFDNLTKKTTTDSLGVGKKKHYVNNYSWNSSTTDHDSRIPFIFKKKEQDDLSNTSNYNNNCILEQTYEKNRFVLKCYLDISLELMSGEDPSEYKKIRRGCLTRKQKIIKLLTEVFRLDETDQSKSETMLSSILRDFGVNLRDMLRDTNEVRRKKRITRRFLKNKND